MYRQQIFDFVFKTRGRGGTVSISECQRPGPQAVVSPWKICPKPGKSWVRYSTRRLGIVRAYGQISRALACHMYATALPLF